MFTVIRRCRGCCACRRILCYSDLPAPSQEIKNSTPLYTYILILILILLLLLYEYVRQKQQVQLGAVFFFSFLFSFLLHVSPPPCSCSYVSTITGHAYILRIYRIFYLYNIFSLCLLRYFYADHVFGTRISQSCAHATYSLRRHRRRRTSFRVSLAARRHSATARIIACLYVDIYISYHFPTPRHKSSGNSLNNFFFLLFSSFPSIFSVPPPSHQYSVRAPIARVGEAHQHFTMYVRAIYTIGILL
jgi:hypothetical protein